MRPTGLTWIALTGLMVLGATTAAAGVTCKVVPSWCPAGDGARDTGHGDARNGVTVSNKGHGEANTSSVSAGTSDVAGGSAGMKTGTNSVGAGAAGVAAGATGVASSATSAAASSAGVATGATSAAASAGSVTTSAISIAAIIGPGQPTPVPEPASLFLLGAGVSAVGAAMRRRRKGSQVRT